MRDAQQIKGVSEVAVAEVLSERRLRPVSEEGVAALLASIETLGVMKDPIQVRRVKHRSGALVLIAGGHRLEAARRLGWETIPATCWDCSDDWAKLMEIDDNVAGAELSAVDTAVFLAERKEVYERLHPETRAEAFKGNRHTGSLAADTMSIASFAAVTAQKFGLSERHVRRLITAGAALNRVGADKLRGTAIPVTLADLMAFSKMTPEQQDVAANRVSNGSSKTLRDAARAFGGAAPSKSVQGSPDQKETTLSDAWDRAPMKIRRAFVAQYLADLTPMVAQARFETGEFK
jgi:ParB family transcriptional regulator, chromosome partitioning protein